MNVTKVAIVLGLVAAIPACKKEDKKGGGAAMPTEKGGGGSGPWAAWNMPGRKAAFQGAWVGPGGAIGQHDAWNVEGTKVTMWDGQQETVGELDLLSPCEAEIMVKGADGSSSGTVHHYTLEGGKLITGLGDAGSKLPDGSAIACVSNTIFTLDAKGTCVEMEADMFDHAKYTPKPATCSFGKNKAGDKDVFKATVHDWETELEVHGDALYTEQIAGDHAEKMADYAAAKTARDAAK